MIKNENYITVSGWMVNDLNLKGTELLLYATIYGFSQDGISDFKGSLAYLAEWCNVDKSTVQRALKSLLEKKLIEKTDVQIANHLKLVTYRTKKQNAHGIGKMHMGHRQNASEGIGKMPTNNINKNNKYIYNKKPKKGQSFIKQDYDLEEIERSLLDIGNLEQ